MARRQIHQILALSLVEMSYIILLKNETFRFSQRCQCLVDNAIRRLGLHRLATDRTSVERRTAVFAKGMSTRHTERRIDLNVKANIAEKLFGKGCQLAVLVV